MRPAVCRHSSRTIPAGPTNGRPCLISCLLGASPTRAIEEPGSPSSYGDVLLIPYLLVLRPFNSLCNLIFLHPILLDLHNKAGLDCLIYIPPEPDHAFLIAGPDCRA